MPLGNPRVWTGPRTCFCTIERKQMGCNFISCLQKIMTLILLRLSLFLALSFAFMLVYSCKASCHIVICSVERPISETVRQKMQLSCSWIRYTWKRKCWDGIGCYERFSKSIFLSNLETLDLSSVSTRHKCHECVYMCVCVWYFTAYFPICHSSMSFCFMYSLFMMFLAAFLFHGMQLVFKENTCASKLKLTDFAVLLIFSEP